VFLKSDGTVFATGRNRYGELGDGTKTQRSISVLLALTAVQGV